MPRRSFLYGAATGILLLGALITYSLYGQQDRALAIGLPVYFLSMIGVLNFVMELGGQEVRYASRDANEPPIPPATPHYFLGGLALATFIAPTMGILILLFTHF